MLSDTVRKVLQYDTSEICCEEARRKIISHLNVRAQKPKTPPNDTFRIDLEIAKIIDEISEMGCEELWDTLDEWYQNYGLVIEGPDVNYIIMDDEQIDEITEDWVRCGSLDIRTAKETDYESRV